MKNRKNLKLAAMQGTEGLNEQFELRAYHIWLASGGGHGNDLDYWLQAEKGIRTRASASIADSKNPDSLEEPNPLRAQTL